jgi:hypothetical protein
MTARSLARMKSEIWTNQAKADTSLKEITARPEAMIQNNQEKMTKLYVPHERMMTRMDSQLDKMDPGDAGSWQKLPAA